LLYVESHLFKHLHLLMQRINSNAFTPMYPEKKQGKLLIVHSPSAKIAKGSDSIIAVMDELKKEYDFTFTLIHNQPREKALLLVKDADIFIDQLVVGGYGMAAMEAMSFGKPVMGYLMPELFKMGLPVECPIVSTTKDNLREKVVALISNAELRHQLGVAGRHYIERYHDADNMAPQLLQLYNEVIQRASLKNNKHHVV
jgi:glycosyltransferase involved in cell wall biosynthesis